MGVVVDGVPIGTIYGVVTDVFDMESVEVLRGPQGTLFGRNVSAGAVVLRSTRPNHEEASGKILVGAGAYGLREISGLYTAPINENWAGKASVLWRDQDGYWDNVALGGEQGARESFVVRPAVSYQGDGFSMNATAEFGQLDGDGMSGRNFLCVGVSALALKDCDPYAANLDPYDRAETRQTTRGSNEIDWFGLSVEGVWDLWDGSLPARSSAARLT